MRRTGSLAPSAPDTLGTVDILGTFDLHGTDLFALVAPHASALVQIHLIEAELGEQSIDRPQWAKVLAERSVYQCR